MDKGYLHVSYKWLDWMIKEPRIMHIIYNKWLKLICQQIMWDQFEGLFKFKFLFFMIKIKYIRQLRIKYYGNLYK